MGVNASIDMWKFKKRGFILIVVICISTFSSNTALNKSFHNPFLYSQKYLDDNKSENVENLVQSSGIHKSYVPIDSMGGSSTFFEINDELSVYHNLKLDLDLSNFYSISVPTGYIADSLQYNITNMEALLYEDTQYRLTYVINKDEYLTTSITGYAFKFDVPQAYMNLSRVRMHITQYGGSYGSDELEIFIVEQDGLGFPNMSAILSTDLHGPYNTANPLPASTPNNFAYYDVENVTLGSGSYFVVANLSTYDIDDAAGFDWESMQVAQGRTFFYNGVSWSLLGAGRTVTFIPELQTVYSNGSIYNYSDPTDVNLVEDGITPITSLTQTIPTNGSHTLTVDSPIRITLNNSYTFTQDFIPISTFQISSSAYLVYSTSWNIDWNFPLLDLISYNNPSRKQFLITPKDWDSTSFLITRNSLTFGGSWIGNGYEIDLDSLISGNQYLGGNMKITTSSPNYISSISQNSETFNLGYWTTNGINATGYNGSVIDASISIDNNDVGDITTGELNFSIFDPSGNIAPFKSDSFLDANLNYIDLSNYTFITNVSTAETYYVNTSFDPSVYGSDQPGYWTVSYFWNNGTEAGFFSKRINVNIFTSVEFFWEETDGGSWINNTLSPIIRINQEEDIAVNVSYYSKSEPYFSGQGVPIEANVSFTSDWGTSGDIPFSVSSHQGLISLDATTGLNTLIIHASGDFLDYYEQEIEIDVYHKFSINPQNTDLEVFYKNQAVLSFQLNDITNSNNIIFADEITLYQDTLEILPTYYDITIDGDYTIISVNTNALNLNPDDYLFRVSLVKDHFVENSITDEVLEQDFNLTIDPATTRLEVVSKDEEVESNSQTVIFFKFIDIVNDDEEILDAMISASIDIDGAEITSAAHDDISGDYRIAIRTFQPTKASMNIFLNISKTGYVGRINYLLTTIKIIIPTVSPGIPLGALIGVIASVALAVIASVIYFYIRTRRRKSLLTKEEKIDRARNIFQSSMMIRKILVVHHETSLPVYEYDIDDNIAIDPSIISGVLQAISTIGMEMIGAPTGIKKIEYYGFVVTSSYSGAYTVYAFSESELHPEIVKGVSNISKWFDIVFGYDSARWDGSMDIFHDYRSSIRAKINEELYLWMIYPLQVAPETLQKLESLSNIDKKIISYINEKGKATSMVLMDKLTEYSDEEILERLIDLVKNELLLTNNTD